MTPTPVFLPGQFHGQRSPVGYSPRGHQESATTERLNAHTESEGITLDLKSLQIVTVYCCLIPLLAIANPLAITESSFFFEYNKK